MFRMRMRILVLALIVLITNKLLAQGCSTLGQTPATAFPICGTDTFSQATVPICSSHNLTVPGCNDGASYADKNPYWYVFTCYTSGTLGFLITPNDLGDDYDWELFDITGHNPNDVFTDQSLLVTGNWAGTYGLTGASASGVNFIQCSSDPQDNKNAFSKMPNIIAGHTYLLLISHFTNSQSGYKLSFGGGTAVITDPKLPHLDHATPGCGGVTITVALNKKMKCSSLAANGSDFSISPANGSVIGAVGIGCSTGFDIDSVVLTMSGGLPPGNYNLIIKNGTDNNSLLDDCDRNIPSGESVPFVVPPLLPTPLDSIAPVGCAPNKVTLVFSKPIQCSTIAADGSDFSIAGPNGTSITGASGACTNGFTSIINLQLSQPILRAGNYRITLKLGNDGNTIIDQCGQQTPTSFIDFTTKDTVNADFTYQILLGCKFDTVQFHHPGSDGVNQWLWNFNNEGTSQLQNPTYAFFVYGPKIIKLFVTNGVCADSSQQTVNLDNTLKADFGYPDVLCPEDFAIFTDHSIGQVISWNWDFGDGDFSSDQNPAPEKYPIVTSGRFKFYQVKLIVENNLGCFDTVVHDVKVVNTCYIAVPNAFTPNNDSKDDYLYPLNAYKTKDLEFNIYNRYGQLVWHTTDWTRKWDGTVNGHPQDSGTYVWTLRYTRTDTGQKIFRKGTTVLIR